MSDWRLEFVEQGALPMLAWLAEAATDSRLVTVHHGSAVETRPHWCVEGTWDGPFEAGDFHRAENLFGSGLRVDGQTLTFCSSVALVDRLFHVTWHDRLLVSNSLIQLLARTGARLNPRHNYRKESFASGHGIKDYPRSFRVVHRDFREIFQEYHCNLVVADGRIERELRSRPRRFASFEEYYDALQSALARITDNYRSAARRHRVAAFATTSTGYDSAAATVLARAAGVTETFTVEVPEGADADEHDSGVRVAESLGLTARALPSTRLGIPDIERYFLAATVEGSEVFLENVAHFIRSNCGAATLYTGYHGDVVWKRPAGTPESIDDMRRKDVSGLNLSEIRLVAGFFNLAVPFIYGRNMADITAISGSSAMASWSLPQDYDRPIPRRIVETAGVPRGLFGQRKRAQVRFYGDPRDPVLRAEFRAYLESKTASLRSRLKLIELLHSADHRLMMMVRRALGLRETPSLLRLIAPDHFDRRSLIFVWAADSLASRFAAVYAASPQARATASR
jgi:hypothetical protein